MTIQQLDDLTPLVIGARDLTRLSTTDGALFALPLPGSTPPAEGDLVYVGTWTRICGSGWLDGVATVLDGPDETGEYLIQWVTNGAIDIRHRADIVKPA